MSSCKMFFAPLARAGRKLLLQAFGQPVDHQAGSPRSITHLACSRSGQAWDSRLACWRHGEQQHLSGPPHTGHVEQPHRRRRGGWSHSHRRLLRGERAEATTRGDRRKPDRLDDDRLRVWARAAHGRRRTMTEVFGAKFSDSRAPTRRPIEHVPEEILALWESVSGWRSHAPAVASRLHHRLFVRKHGDVAAHRRAAADAYAAIGEPLVVRPRPGERLPLGGHALQADGQEGGAGRAPVRHRQTRR